ncbi:MAG TPA: 30S ribosomal protein S9 [Bacteroidia bacterium]|nr:30S ribosomal protein S9 [Bacteroidia bacterium]MBN8692508.1 30S ribosomal protein S9 [Bacteroidota bacterium]HRD39411.1 30S ribosomal protein S9 [Bacteroidia bacterium]
MEVINTSGRRKTSVARAYITKGKGNIEVNGKDYKVYFSTPTLQYYVTQALNIAKVNGEYDIKANVKGGGITGQAQAIRLAIAKALVEINEEYKKDLRAEGLMTRDPRMVERKKFGQKKARRRFQFSKR